MKKKFKSAKGFTSVDIAIALIILIMFVSIMASMSYNIYLSTVEAKRTAVALNYSVDIFEHIGAIDFDEVMGSYELLDFEGLESFVCTNADSTANPEVITGTIDNIYDVTLTIEDYEGQGVVKIITLKMEYKVSKNNTESMELQRIKTVEQ